MGRLIPWRSLGTSANLAAVPLNAQDSAFVAAATHRLGEYRTATQDARRAELTAAFRACAQALGDAAAAGDWDFVRENLTDLVVLGSAVEMVSRGRPAFLRSVDDWRDALLLASALALGTGHHPATPHLAHFVVAGARGE